MSVTYQIERLINFGLKKELIKNEDVVFTRNSIIGVLGLAEPYEGDSIIHEDLETATEILDNILDFCVSKNMIEDTITERDLMSARIMGLFIDRPSNINKKFFGKLEKSREAATDYFYKLSRDSNYIQVDRIKKNIPWIAETEYGHMEITINLSKPEKDPKEIEKLKNQVPKNYPKCLLCKENEGFFGNLTHPARENLRLIHLNLAEEEWYFQYSPYLYYNEHCIVLKSEHTPMFITEKTFVRLLDFIDLMPHYFLGSNAGLPIVGGSILNHDHYQGGRYIFPMDKAEVVGNYVHDDFTGISISTLKWPLNVVQISCSDRNKLTKFATYILEKWSEYTDESAGVFAETEKGKHNAITPIAKKRENGDYQLNLVLRNNLYTDEFPYGVFHPHEEYHHIKKENIGLIEVMGLAILPGRLKDELEEISDILTGKKEYNESQLENPENSLYLHKHWVKRLYETYNNSLTEEKALEILRKEVGEIFVKVLGDSGVFKDTEVGREQFKRFLTYLGCK